MEASVETKTNMQLAMEAYVEQQNPIYHTPIHLGINYFKRELAINFPDITKSVRNRLVKSFKKRSWMEYQGISKGRGTFPTHPAYGKSVKVNTGTGMNSAEFEVKVNNGKQKQK